jgi:hypothetical protein
VQDEAAEREAREALTDADTADLETAAQQAGEQAVREAEADAVDEEVLGDFVFDASGARVGAGHPAAEVSDIEAEAVLAPAAPADGKASEPPRKKKRCTRKRRILTQAPGMEATADGEVRIEEEGLRRPRMFAASSYFWLYYAADGVQGLTKKVGINKGSGPHGSAARGEYHAILLDAADTDADSIPGSNSTYEFAGMHSNRPELLYTRTYSCMCATCREPTNITVESCSCPVVRTVGRWRQQTIYSSPNVGAQRKVMVEAIKDFQVWRANLNPVPMRIPEPNHLITLL